MTETPTKTNQKTASSNAQRSDFSAKTCRTMRVCSRKKKPSQKRKRCGSLSQGGVHLENGTPWGSRKIKAKKCAHKSQVQDEKIRIMQNENTSSKLLAEAATELEHFRKHHSNSDCASHFPSACRRLLRSLPGNQNCIDCGRCNPDWASVTFGSLICLKCSGLHRSYGVGTSVVRSIDMDAWTHSQILKVLEGGNAQLEGFFDRHYLGRSSPTANCRYRTKAGKFYATHLQHHVDAVSKAGKYRGREASRKIQPHLQTSGSTSRNNEQQVRSSAMKPIAVK